MGKRNVSYNISWEADFAWLRPSKDSLKALCTICDRDFRIDGGGKSQVESHAKGAIHAQRLQNQKGQCTFVR